MDAFFEVSDLNVNYGRHLDNFAWDDWLDLFTEEAVYRAQPRENFDRDLPLSTIYCDGKGMLRDRVTAITETLVYSPRAPRHVIGQPHIMSVDGEGAESEAGFAIFQTQPDRPTEILAVGRYIDRAVRCEDGALRFAERRAVFDSLLLPNALVYPL